MQPIGRAARACLRAGTPGHHQPVHPEPTPHHAQQQVRPEASHAHEAAECRGSRAPRARRATGRTEERDAWLASHDGQVAQERAAEELAHEQVQHLDHAGFLEAFEVAWIPAAIGWTVTDEFARRHGRLRGRSHRAVGAAMTAFVGDLASLAPFTHLRGRAGLEVRPVPKDSPLPAAWALSWSNEGRATYLLEWLRTPDGPVAHVTWLTIGPHGAPDRRRWRGNA